VIQDYSIQTKCVKRSHAPRPRVWSNTTKQVKIGSYRFYTVIAAASTFDTYILRFWFSQSTNVVSLYLKDIHGDVLEAMRTTVLNIDLRYVRSKCGSLLVLRFFSWGASGAIMRVHNSK